MDCYDWNDEEWPTELEPLRDRVEAMRKAPTYPLFDLLLPLLALAVILPALWMAV